MIFSANTGFLWPDLSFSERIFRAHTSGFGAVEFHDEAQLADLEEIADILSKTGLPLLGLNTRMGDTAGCAALAGQEGKADLDFEKALCVADRLGAKAIHVMSGRTEASDRLDVLTSALSRFTALTDRTLLVEPISSLAMQGYAIADISEAADVLERVGSPNVRILFDTYHISSMGHDLIKTYRRFEPLIGHVQISAPGTRLKPTENDREIHDFLREIRLEYVGCEWLDPGLDARPLFSSV